MEYLVGIEVGTYVFTRSTSFSLGRCGIDDGMLDLLRGSKEKEMTRNAGASSGADNSAGNVFRDALQGLERGDFSRLNPLFESRDGETPLILQWEQAGLFTGNEEELAEALTCASFNGALQVAEHLLKLGVQPSGGARTGLNAIHWAANRGQLEAVRLLIRYKVPLETRSMYGATALGAAVHAAIYEVRTPHHHTIIRELIAGGADIREAGYPTGDEAIDSLLRSHGAQANDSHTG